MAENEYVIIKIRKSLLISKKNTLMFDFSGELFVEKTKLCFVNNEIK